MISVKNIGLLGLIGSLLVLLPGCGSSMRYEPRELRDLTVVSADHWIVQDDVTVLTKRFNRQDNKYYFNKSSIPYAVIQVTVHNNSSNDWVLTKEAINMPIVDLNTVIKKLCPSYMRSIGMKMLVGPDLASMYSLRQLDNNNRIAQDMATKTVDQPVTIAAGCKQSVALFINNRSLKSRLRLKLGHAVIPGKYLNFELSV